MVPTVRSGNPLPIGQPPSLGGGTSGEEAYGRGVEHA